MSEYLLCSNCFRDHGLQLDARRLGISIKSVCSNCNSSEGRKLNRDAIARLAYTFFVMGSLRRLEYGAAPIIQFNEAQPTSISVSTWLEQDLKLFEKAIGIGFFPYGPRLWMIGEVEPLKSLQEPGTRSETIQTILNTYPAQQLTEDDIFYRIRKDPALPAMELEYDSPPAIHCGKGRFDLPDFPIMYASEDLQLCIHECRVTAEDDLFVASLSPTRRLKLLDLTELLVEEHLTEFESLDMAVHMLFLAGQHSYDIARDIARAAQRGGYDGLIYPSYFSLLRTGAFPFETAFGISHRKLESLIPYEKSKIVPNIAIFGRPIQENKISVRCINRLLLRRVEYEAHFGPIA